MDGPIQRAGKWWQRHQGHWYRWSESTKQWERQTGGPPAPARPSGRPATSPAQAPAAPSQPRPRATRPRASATKSDDSRFAETWATSKAKPASAAKTEELPDWYPDLNKPEPKAKTSPMLVRLIVFLIATALSATGYFGLKGDGSANVDEAFAPLAGYEYQDVPPEVMEGARSALEDVGADEVIHDLDARALYQGGRPVGAVLVYAVPPDLFAAEGEAGFEFALQQTPGTTYEKVPRDGTMMYELSMPGAAQGTFFDEQDGLLISVVTQDITVMRDASGQLARMNLSN